MARELGTRAPKPGRSIRHLLLITLLVLLVPVLVVQTASYYAQFRSRRERELRADLESAASVAKSVELALQEISRDEIAIGHIFVTPPPPPRPLWNAVLQRYAQYYRAIPSFQWVDSQGRVAASSAPAATGRDVSGGAWFGRIAAGADWVVTDLERDAPGGGFEVAQSIRDGQGKLLGAVLATVEPGALAQEIDLPSGGGRTISVLDHSGWLVFQSPPRREDVKERDWRQRYPVVAEALRGEPRSGSGMDPRLRERHLYALAPVRSVGWVVAVAEPEAQVTGPIVAGLVRDGALVIGVAAVAFLLAIVTVRRIAKPVERLSRYALAIGRGEYPASVSVHGPRELESLSQAFDRMARDVAQREHEHEELLESERARARDAGLLAAIQGAISSSLVYVDSDLRVLRANPAAEAMLGRSRDELIGHTAADVLARAPNILALLERARESREEIHLTEYRHTLSAHPELGERRFDISISPVTGGEGSFEGLVIVSVDVTERVQQRERLLAEERARAKLAETLNAEISHRLKNHLMMAFTLLHMQMQQAEDERVKAALRDTAARLLTFASIHEQLQASPEGRVDLLAAVQRIAELARDTTGARATVTVEGIALELPSRAATSLALVANELVTNAIKRGGPGTNGKLDLRVGLRRDDGELTLSVWNSGNPVPEGFDPSKQRGMGLQLVLTIIEGYEGSFTLRPEGGGSLAEVRIAEDKLAA
jgi:PAS domain S-box-containing protein